jgi:hypothetical protein
MSHSRETGAGSPSAKSANGSHSVSAICDIFEKAVSPSETPQYAMHAPRVVDTLIQLLSPIKRAGDGKVHPAFPQTFRDYLRLTEKQLDSLAQWYGQWNKEEVVENEYPREINIPFGTPFFRTSIGFIAPYSLVSIKKNTALTSLFMDTVLSDKERVDAKRWMFGYFIGVEEESMSAVHAMRLARWLEEMEVLLCRFSQQASAKFWFVKCWPEFEI